MTIDEIIASVSEEIRLTFRRHKITIWIQRILIVALLVWVVIGR